MVYQRGQQEYAKRKTSVLGVIYTPFNFFWIGLSTAPRLLNLRYLEYNTTKIIYFNMNFCEILFIPVIVLKVNQT